MRKDSGNTAVTAAQYLYELQRLNRLISSRKEKLEAMRESAASLGSLDYSKDRVQTSPAGEAPYARKIECSVDLEDEIRKLTDQYEAAVSCIEPVLREVLSQRGFVVVTLKFLDDLTWEEISDRTGMDISVVHRLYADSMKVLRSIIF